MTAIDKSISRMNFNTALFLYDKGCPIKTETHYKEVLFFEFNLKKFYKYLTQKREVDNNRIFRKKARSIYLFFADVY
jgi:hypothetical protein